MMLKRCSGMMLKSDSGMMLTRLSRHALPLAVSQ